MRKLAPEALYSFKLRRKKRNGDHRPDPVTRRILEIDPDGSKARDLLRQVRAGQI